MVNGPQAEVNFVDKIMAICRSDFTYEGVSKSFRTGRLEWELQMVQCSCIAILWVSLV